MNNYNELLENLRQDVIRLEEEGYTIMEIATELNVGREWVYSIINNIDNNKAVEAVFNAINNDKKYRIASKEALGKITNLSLDKVNRALKILVEVGRISKAKLWKRELLASVDKEFYKSDEMKDLMDMYDKGYNTYYIGYVFGVNPNTLRKHISSYRIARGMEKRKTLISPSLTKDKMMMEYTHFINHHLDDLTDNMDEKNKELFKMNLEKLTDEVVDNFDIDSVHEVMINDKGNKRNWTKDEEAQLIKMKQEGYKNSEIAKELRRTLSAVRLRINMLRKDGVIIGKEEESDNGD